MGRAVVEVLERCCGSRSKSGACGHDMATLDGFWGEIVPHSMWGKTSG